ncbi:MAG: DUF2807 domain-containing protein [Desulforhopalus sp.]|nr:DUF2807 domain-containing protein [Desulforhopalus sp.]
MISKNHSMPFSELLPRFSVMLGLSLASLLLVFPVEAVEINIGSNNQVNTGKIVSGNCLQGSGKLTQKKLPVEQFKGIVVDGVFDVSINCGQSTGLSITADDNLHSLISATTKNGKLHLSTLGSYCTANSFKADISLVELVSVSADGSSELVVNCNTAVNSKLSVDLRGASSMTLSGKVKDVDLILQDSTELDASQLLAETVGIKISDAASARVNASKKLTGEGSDASEIHYLGQPQVVKVKTSDASECLPEE